MNGTPARSRNYVAGCMVFVAGTFAVITVLALAGNWMLRGELRGFPSLTRRIALVEISGVIRDSRDLVEEMDRYGEDPTIRAVVLRIDSPGGSVAPSQELYEAVRRLRDRDKPVVVSMGEMCASGGYYVACAADTVVANPGSLTASIGVIMDFPTASELMRKVGVRWEIVKSGRVKDVASTWRDLSPEGRAVLQSLVDDAYNQFVDAVADGRGLDRAQVLAIADGRPLTGHQALEAGLVDKLGDLQAAVDCASAMAHITGKPTLVRHNERPSAWYELLRRFLEPDRQGSELMMDAPPVRLEYRMF
ncbi:MAG TPA: signal peptide peptidase SppA [Candidatus Saccharimonadales bacterium]|nr:signal peptide peptidase SppA [Candidatus Saccharimonadales bacterium]